MTQLVICTPFFKKYKFIRESPARSHDFFSVTDSCVCVCFQMTILKKIFALNLFGEISKTDV